MHTKFLRRGQAQHLFNDLLHGIILVILGVILLSYATSSQDDKIRRDVDDRLWENYGERQLLQFLQTRVLHLGEHKEIWQILYEAQDHEDWIKSVSELRAAGSYDYGILWGDALLAQFTAPLIFDRLFEDWYMLISYHQFDYQIQINYQQRALREQCLQRNGRDYRADVEIPGEHGMTVYLYYCIVPEATS